jgi:murein hydrolase activator
MPRPRPAPAVKAPEKAPPSSDDGVTDLSHAIPAKKLTGMPSTADQFHTLQKEIAEKKPAVQNAKETSETLAQQAMSLQQRLAVTASRVEALEEEKLRCDADIARLSAENDRLSESFNRDRAKVSRLLALLERVQHGMPPAMVLKPDDVLAAARGTMLIGAGLPEVYGAAARLARRIDHIRITRQALVERRAAATKNAADLARARVELGQLLVLKQSEANNAAARYGSLRQRLETAARQAVNLQMLLEKAASLREVPVEEGVVTVGAAGAAQGAPARGSLLRPVAGALAEGGLDGVGEAAAPGLTYLTFAGAQVISPADGTVLFAGPYQKSGHVLILQIAGGYDAVLAGMARLDIGPGDRLLAGEPVGRMPDTGTLGSGRQPKLYFELRHNGRGISPAPYISAGVRKAKKS